MGFFTTRAIMQSRKALAEAEKAKKAEPKVEPKKEEPKVEIKAEPVKEEIKETPKPKAKRDE